MAHALANVIFEYAGLIALSVTGATIWHYRAKIRRALNKRG